MKKTIFTFLSFIISLSTISAQNGIDFKKKYSTGGKLFMSVDSGAKNINYANKFPNQPRTSFNYLPEVNNLNIQIYFKKDVNIQNYRYTILADDKPIVVNQSINKAELKNVDMPEEIFTSSASLGTFAIKGKVITVLAYSADKPQDIDKTIFYGRFITKAKIKYFSKIIAFDKGSASDTDLNERKNFSFAKADKELVIIKDKSEFDYLYYTAIKNKKTNEIIFRSTAWEYGHFLDDNGYLPHVSIDKNIFKKSGEYEIVIQPYIKWNVTPKDLEKYITRHRLSITLEEESYSKKDLLAYGLIICAVFGAIAGALLTYVKKKEVKKLVQQYKEKEIVELQLSSVRSQLNPHFLFNALAGIQNLMNKNEIDNANKYLSKFARLTRNVLNNKELVSLAQEKTLLDDYLQMEQLRFGFSYEIKTDDNLDLQNIEIPSMLMQPFVENAVKHGIASKTTEGNIEIAFSRNGNNLLLKVADNGKGFDTDKKHEGLGLSLSKNRISLLNSIYKETPFVLAINSKSTGSEINLTLTDWL